MRWAGSRPQRCPAGLATGFPFALPSGAGLWLLLLLGGLTAAAQYLLSFAYKVADATYLQPFGDLKVPLSGLVGWVVPRPGPEPLVLARRRPDRRRLELHLLGREPGPEADIGGGVNCL